LTLDWVILHTIAYHISPVPVYMTNFTEIKVISFVARLTYTQTDELTLPSSKSRDTKIKTNIKKSGPTNLDIVPYFKNL